MRFPRHFAAFNALLAISLFATAYAADERSAAQSTFRAGTTEWAAAYNAGEPERIVALYADDAIVMPPDTPSVSGHAAVRAYLVKDIASSRKAGLTLSIADDDADADASGNVGWHTGTFKLVGSSGETVGTGKFVEIWERQAGKWRLIRDIWNNDAPPAPDSAGQQKT